MALKSSINVGCGTYSYEITSPPKPAPEPQDPVFHCNPTNSPNYASYDSINYQDFCKNLQSLEYMIEDGSNPPFHSNLLRGGTSRTTRYNDKTPDALDISIQVSGPNTESQLMISEYQCNVLFKKLLDGCNVPADHNLMNLKHGKLLIQFERPIVLDSM